MHAWNAGHVVGVDTKSCSTLDRRYHDLAEGSVEVPILIPR